jgi:hypothetical protein
MILDLLGMSRLASGHLQPFRFGIACLQYLHCVIWRCMRLVPLVYTSGCIYRPVRILYQGQLLSNSSLTDCWRVNLQARLLICGPVLTGRERLYTKRRHLSPIARDVASTPRVVVQFIRAAAAARDVRDVHVVPGPCRGIIKSREYLSIDRILL